MAVRPAKPRLRGWLLWGWFAVMLALTLVTFAATPSDWLDEGNVMFLLLALVYTGVGAVVANRSPGNRIAWLMLVAGLSLLTSAATNNVLVRAPASPDLLELLAIYIGGTTIYMVGIAVPLALLLFWFPTGRFLTRRWSRAGWLAGSVVGAQLFGATFAAEVGAPWENYIVENPIGLVPSIDPFVFFAGIGTVVLLVSGVLSMVTRYRRSGVVVRTQIKWVAYSAIFTAFSLGLLMVGNLWDSYLATGAAALALLSVPVSIAVAITRYRLFEIDRLVSRTVGYAIVIGVLAATFALLIALPGLLIGSAEASPLVVAASTLAVAALFDPVRKRVIGWIDRRFNRSRYDAERVVAGFGDRLQDEVDLDRVTNDSIDVVVETMQPETIGIWVKE